MKDKTQRGGARKGCGRKKREVVPVVSIDGRTVNGQQHAQALIDQLNAIDPQIIRDRDLLVSAEPIEIPKDADDELVETLKRDEARRQVLWAAKQKAAVQFSKLSYEVQGWALLWFEARTALETRKYLYDKAKGKATITVNHLHDKPFEMNVNVSMAEVVRKVRLRKQEYERSRTS